MSSNLLKIIFTAIFLVGFIVIAILGVLYDGAPFEFVFPAMSTIVGVMVYSLFKQDQQPC